MEAGRNEDAEMLKVIFFENFPSKNLQVSKIICTFAT